MDNKHIDNILEEFAEKADQAFSEGINFSDESGLAKACNKLLQKLNRYRIGPRALVLLVAFAFKEKKREKIWRALEKAVRTNKD